ncbi:MAG: M16 family metallopeptidase [Gemmatimonadaceae bacterium]
MTRQTHASSRPAPPAPPRPAPAEPRPYNFPRFERRTLSNGVRLVVAPVHKLPLVTAIALVDAGAAEDPEGREGLAQLTARALTEGTASADGAALTERVERLGTSIDASADWDTALVRMTVGAGRLSEAMALFGEVLRAPSFPERELERLKAERLAEILAQRAEPRGLADEMFDRFAYATGARYGRPEGGAAEAVTALGRADVEAFYRERYRPDATTLVIVGDVSVHDAERVAREVFGSWAADGERGAGSGERAARPGEGPPPRSALRARRPLDEASPSPRAVHVVEKTDAPQSELRVGHVGVPRKHPDYFPITVMNAILGGLFSSRINLNLREAHGYTYGAHSGYEWRRGAGPFSISTAVRSDVTDAAAREVLAEVDRMRSAPVAADELSLATSYLDGVFPIRYETTSAIASALANLVLYGLPDDYYDRYRSVVRAVSAGDVLEAARRHLAPDRFQIVVVGDPAAIRAPLEALGAGPVRVYDAEGRQRR